MRALLGLFLLAIFSAIVYSQPKASIQDIHNIYDEKGDYYFDKKEYKKAIVYYNMAYKQDPNNYYSVLRKAEAFTSLELNDQAAECYRIIFETDRYISNEYRLQYALLLLKNKDIKGYEKWMGIYNEIVRSEIHDYTSSTEVRAKMYRDSSFILVENEYVLNTAESEICPSIYQDKVIFASDRKNLSGNSASDHYNLFSASYSDEGRLGKLNIFNRSLNSSQSERSISLYEKSGKLYFSRSTAANSGLKTYIASIPANANERLEIYELIIEGFSSVGHVSFNSSGTKMYFVSDAPGGLGGLDIYSSDLAGSKWSKPVNLGKSVNSGKDEMYPFVLNDTMLYFSSAGHNSLGGLDLFSVNLKQQNSAAKNLGSKVNSQYDDYGLSFSPGGLTGYFSSNRPGGFGKEDIYRLHLMDIKVKLPAYKFKRKPFIESDKINLYLSSGSEYNIASEDKSGFNFSFLPEEPYKMVIQHENPLASNVIYNEKLSADQKKREFLYPQPFQKTDIRLQTGMKYRFTAGMKPISDEYTSALHEMSKAYQNATSTIDLTALAKELLLTEGEIYTIRFVKDDDRLSDAKAKGESGLFINEKIIPVSGESFFVVLPLDIQVNFNILTDLAHFKENFNPKKVGTVKVDESPVYKEEQVQLSEGFPILVNSETFSEVSQKQISATELNIIPGSMYILSFRKTGAGPDDPGVVVPLTKGVKYNLGTEAISENEYNKALAQMTAGQAADNKPNEELIDISVLSKELDIMSEKDIVFSLVPARQFSSQASGAGNVLTTLSVDGRKYFVTDRVKMLVNLKLDQTKKVNIQTDLSYVKENFESSAIALKLDTSSFRTDLKELKENIITDPVYDVIVINFDLNEYSIRSEAKSVLTEKVIKTLKGDSRLYVTIKGYTDPLGDDAYNEKLSMNRAQAVKDFLSTNGIGENRIRTFSYGKSEALKDGRRWEDLSEEELQKHRKVEIIIYLPK